jgi:hypothetical protein
MKLTLMLPALAGFLILTGCDTPTPSLLSLDPVATGQDAIVDSLLIGAWESDSSGNQLCVIHRDGDKGYNIAYLGGGSPLAFDARQFQVGDARLLELTPSDGDDFHVKGHVLARVWTEGSKLRWAFLDSDWLRQQASQLLNHTEDNKMLLLAPGPAVRAFIEKYGADDRAYGDQVTWQRVQ